MDKKKVATKRETWTFVERSFSVDVPGVERDGDFLVDGLALDAAERAVAEAIVREGVASGKEVKFLRKKAGITAAELAEALDVTPVSVSHWENDKKAMSASTRIVIADLARRVFSGEEKDKVLADVRRRGTAEATGTYQVPALALP